jgi:hypothetical protein
MVLTLSGLNVLVLLFSFSLIFNRVVLSDLLPLITFPPLTERMFTIQNVDPSRPLSVFPSVRPSVSPKAAQNDLRARSSLGNCCRQTDGYNRGQTGINLSLHIFSRGRRKSLLRSFFALLHLLQLSFCYIVHSNFARCYCCNFRRRLSGLLDCPTQRLRNSSFSQTVHCLSSA